MYTQICISSIFSMERDHLCRASIEADQWHRKSSTNTQSLHQCKFIGNKNNTFTMQTHAHRQFPWIFLPFISPWLIFSGLFPFFYFFFCKHNLHNEIFLEDTIQNISYQCSVFEWIFPIDHSIFLCAYCFLLFFISPEKFKM